MNKVLPISPAEPPNVLHTTAPCAGSAPRRRAIAKPALLTLAFLMAIGLIGIVSLWALSCYRVLSDDPTVWQSSIDRLNAKDVAFQNSHVSPLLFVGSSSIRLFKGLETLFYNDSVLKKGFGGAKIADVVYYKHDLILKHQPKLLVLYIGTNDLLYRDYKNVNELTPPLFALLDEIQQALLNTDIVLLAQRPIDNPDLVGQIHNYNMQLAQYAYRHKRVFYVNSNQALQNPDGTVKTSLLHWDGLHLNKNGFDAWGNAIHKQLRSLQLVQ